MRTQQVNQLYRTASVIGLLIGRIGLVGLVLSQDGLTADELQPNFIDAVERAGRG